MNTDTTNINERFTVERKIPLMLVWVICSTMVINLGTSIWWAANADNRIKQLEKTDSAHIVERLVAVEVKIDQAAQNFGYNRKDIEEIKEKLEQIADRKK